VGGIVWLPSIRTYRLVRRGNFQFSSGEDTLENYKGILSANGASEGSTGVLSIPGYSPALPQFNTLLPEPYFYY
jgi:hypothetical protein